MQVVQLDPTLAASIDALQKGMQKEDIHAQVEQTVNDAIRDYIREMQSRKLGQEQRAFEEQHERLVGGYLGKYVAFHNGQMIDSDENQRALHLRVRKQFPDTVIGIFPVRKSSEMPIIHLRSVCRVTEHQS